jgi:hypothetical protein
MTEEKITKIQLALAASAIAELSTLGYIPRLAIDIDVIAAGVAAALENVLTVGLTSNMTAIEPVKTVQLLGSDEPAFAGRRGGTSPRTQRVLQLHGDGRPPTYGEEIAIPERPPPAWATFASWSDGLNGPPIAPPAPPPVEVATADEVGELRERLAAIEAAQKTPPAAAREAPK